jgi:ABC-type lipoprotein release transport system permease subunit
MSNYLFGSGALGALVTAMLIVAGAAPHGQSSGRSDAPGVLISRQLAEGRNLRVGDVIRLSTNPSGAGAREFRVDGTYEPLADPMRFAQKHFEARFHLPDLLSLTADPTDPNAGDTVTAINVALVDPSEASAFARDVAARLPGIVARPTSAPDERTSTFVVLDRFHLAIAIVTVVGSAVFLLAMMVMLVDARRATVGILRLIGFTRRRILLQVFSEGALIALAGTAFGILFALSAQRFFNEFFQWRYDTALVFLRITPRVVAQSVLLAVPLGILASVIASWTLLRQQLLSLIRR